MAACISGKGRLHAVDVFVGAFNAPKASSADDHVFHEVRCCFVHIKV